MNHEKLDDFLKEFLACLKSMTYYSKPRLHDDILRLVFAFGYGFLRKNIRDEVTGNIGRMDLVATLE